jgi:Xaa-Pro aminopeptidase
MVAKGFPRLSVRDVKRLPIRVTETKKTADKASHDEMVKLVDKMLGLVPKLRKAKTDSERKTLQNAVTATDRAIDQLVYKLYDLTADEIKLVEQSG